MWHVQTIINLGKETDSIQLLEEHVTPGTGYLKTVYVQLTKLFVDARNNLIFMLFRKDRN